MDIATISEILDTMLNSNEGGITLDEYEKSLYMTKAQDIYYDAILENFEITNIISEQIDRLLRTDEIESFTDDTYNGKVATLTFPSRKILREKVTFTNDTNTSILYRGKSMQVHEDRLSEIESSLKNPFRKPEGDVGVLRAIYESTYVTGTTNAFPNTKMSLYLPDGTAIGKYTVTYAREPNPILLEALPDGLTIRGKSDATVGTELEFKDKDIEKILNIAVDLVLDDGGAVGVGAGPLDDKAAAILGTPTTIKGGRRYLQNPNAPVDYAVNEVLKAPTAVSGGGRRTGNPGAPNDSSANEILATPTKVSGRNKNTVIPNAPLDSKSNAIIMDSSKYKK